MWIPLLFLLVGAHGYLTPQCRQLCDDPICNAVCEPACNVTQCDYQCTGGLRICQPPVCTVRCPPDQSVADACPACETVCEPLVCSDTSVSCSALCEPTACQWACRTPYDWECPQIRCEWQCERPACEFQGTFVFSAASRLTGSVMLLLFALFIFVQ